MKKMMAMLLAAILLLTACQSQRMDLSAQAGQNMSEQTQPKENTAEAVRTGIQRLTYSGTPDEHISFTTSFGQFELEDCEGRSTELSEGTHFQFEGNLSVDALGLIGEERAKMVFFVPYSERYNLMVLPGSFYALVSCGRSSSSVEGASIREAEWTINSWTVKNGEAPLEMIISQGCREDSNSSGYRVRLYMSAVSGMEASWTDERIRVGIAEEALTLQVYDNQGCKQSQELILDVKGEVFDLVTDRLEEGIIGLETASGLQELPLEWIKME